MFFSLIIEIVRMIINVYFQTSVAIFEMIEYYESACKVNISFNKNISIRGWQSCARMIRKVNIIYV